MNSEKSKEINEQVMYGLSSIDPEQTVEIKLKDLMFLYKIFEEFNRFFHQPLHFSTIEDINSFLGDRDSGAYSLISKIYYQLLPEYIPERIMEKLGKENDPFTHPNDPYYYKKKNDKKIYDGTLGVIDRNSFSKFASELLADYKMNGENWENNSLESFIEGIASYAEDIDGYYSNMKFDTSADTPTWRIFAQILKGAAVYE